jgi:hypothetical protein
VVLAASGPRKRFELFHILVSQSQWCTWWAILRWSDVLPGKDGTRGERSVAVGGWIGSRGVPFSAVCHPSGQGWFIR